MDCPKCGHPCFIDKAPTDIPGWPAKIWTCGGCGWSEDDIKEDEEDEDGLDEEDAQ